MTTGTAVLGFFNENEAKEAVQKLNNLMWSGLKLSAALL
jgi:RNA recognition motif-containing protein